MFLNKIIATKHEEVKQLKETFSITLAEQRIVQMPNCLGFIDALAHGRNRGMGLIAEVKKASPSKGLIRADFDPIYVAKSYMAAGADCLSVLTDVEYFQGNNSFLSEIKQTVPLPVLRKDFTIDVLQIYEARLIGADAILLIVAILTDTQLQEFSDLASQLGLDILIEVHDKGELERVLQLDFIRSPLIGINNRNLRTFETNLQTTAELIELIPKGTLVVSESGISKPSEIEWLASIGAGAVLIGEHFMRQTSIVDGVIDLMGPVVIEGKG